jgi:class 3 adenylate cyclase/predicted ATPase
MSDPSNRGLIEAAIAAQEQLRRTLGDEVVDVTIRALRAQLGPAEDPTIEHERRLVTVLFMDVVDSTRILQGLDPEEVMVIMDSALQSLAGGIDARGGRVVKFMGDGFLAVFGLRRTRENDAEMAVRAGLEVVRHASTIGADVARAHGIAGFDVRVGINTGLVVIGGATEARDTVMGSAVSLASRIETAAPPGGVLISQSTYRQVRGLFELQAAGTIDAKGFPEPVPVHRVIAALSDRHLESTRGIEDVDVELVGRDEQLGTLLQAFNEVVTSGTARTVTITGDAGIGKSRLLAEFEARLPPDPPRSTFRARGGMEGANVPYSLLRDLVERCFDIRSDDPVAVVGEKLAAGLGTGLAPGPNRAAKVTAIGQLLGYDSPTGDDLAGGHDPQHLRDRAVSHLVEFFREETTDGPVLLLLDDLQWTDDSSLEVLRDVIEGLTAHPLLTIALTRPTVRESSDALARLPNELHVQLEGLSPSESETLADSILSRIGDCPPQLRGMLLEHAGGNPYYLEELVMMCIDDGIIVVGDPAWSVHIEKLQTLRVPTTLTGVIRARLDSLPGSEHGALQQASVVGRVFWDAVVAQIAGRPSDPAVDRNLHSLQARQMIHARSPSAFSHASEYAFSHTLLRDATYEEVLLDDRRAYHGITADWLIAASGDRQQEYAGLIAGHLEKAGRSAEALAYLTHAAEAAWSSYAISTAADFYSRAIALVPDDDLETRYKLLLGREKTSALQGDREAQRCELDELEQIAHAIGDPARQALVAVERTFLGFYTSDYAAALASARRAAEYAAATDDLALQGRTRTALAWALYYVEDWDAGRAQGEEALVIARELATAQSAGAARIEATAQNLLGMIALTTGELSEARMRLSRALEISQVDGDREAASTYLNNLGVVLTMLGHYEAAEGNFSEIMQEAVESGDRSSESAARLNLAWVAAAGGAWELARTHAKRGIDMKRRHEHLEAEAEGLLWLGHALLGLAELDDAQAAYEESIEIRRTLQQTGPALGAEAGLVRVALARDDIGDAMSHAENILSHLDQDEKLEGTWEPLRIHLTAIEALIVAGDERTERVLRRAERVLHAGAEKITDADDRRSYLEAIPWHSRIQELAAGSAE